MVMYVHYGSALRFTETQSGIPDGLKRRRFNCSFKVPSLSERITRATDCNNMRSSEASARQHAYKFRPHDQLPYLALIKLII